MAASSDKGVTYGDMEKNSDCMLGNLKVLLQTSIPPSRTFRPLEKPLEWQKSLNISKNIAQIQAHSTIMRMLLVTMRTLLYVAMTYPYIRHILTSSYREKNHNAPLTTSRPLQHAVLPCPFCVIPLPQTTKLIPFQH